ncbi:hypothetical protein BKA62DRAFT_831774 [Auriculariales sp. MPI-PUGE-AT-0066]|nr:hypothetical protein BKA62DRAFT_831774 [Auriculariales sp. MPI-PUGE-AT-0066]
MTFRIVALVALSFLITHIHAKNVTIDDTQPAWSFSPVDVFGAVSVAKPCTACTSQLDDPSKAYSGTWRDCVKNGTATLQFHGTGVTVYTICPGPHTGGSYVGHFTFSLNGQARPEFLEKSTGCATYLYNYPIFSVSGLELADHSIAISNVDTGSGSNFLLDYAVVNDGTEDPSNPAATTPTTENKKANLPIAAIVVPVVVVVILSLAGMALLVRRRRHMHDRAKLDDATPTPFKTPDMHTDDGSSIPMMVYNPPVDSAATALAHVQASGHDPELEAALHIIAARSRQNAQETTPTPMHMAGSPATGSSPPTSPTAPAVGWSRDRKGSRQNLRDNAATATGPSSTVATRDTTPPNSNVGSNWTGSTAINTTDATPPTYLDATATMR